MGSRLLTSLLHGAALALLLPRVPAAQGDPGKTTLAVLDFTNSALVRTVDYAPFARGISDMLMTELSRNASVIIVERHRLLALLDEQDLLATGRIDQAAAVRLGKVLGAEYVLTGGFVIDSRERIRLDARAVSVETSAVAHVESVSGKADDLLDLVTELASKLNRTMRLGEVTPAIAAPSAPRPSGGPSPQRMQALLLYSTALVEDERKQTERARTLYQRFLDETPGDFATDQRRHAQQRLLALPMAPDGSP